MRVARASARQREPAEVGPAETPERFWLQCGVALASSSAPTTNSCFGGAAAALPISVRWNVGAGGGGGGVHLSKRCFGRVSDRRKPGSGNRDAFVDCFHSSWSGIIGPVKEQKLLLIILNALGHDARNVVDNTDLRAKSAK
jgi:hypothetical protein